MKALVLWLAALLPVIAQAHGYLSQPASRSYQCKLGQNSQCGQIQYEPQSLEALSGFPAAGPADGQIASAGHAAFGALDEQTASRWSRVPVGSGTQTFTWTFTANHVTRNIRYFMTKPDWNPNAQIGRASFDLTPFCTWDGGMRQPPSTLSHTCQVPARSGYHLILAVWEVGDTVNSFYNVVDAQMGPPPDWQVVGTIAASKDLAVGSSVSTRVFNAAGEQPAWSTSLAITTASQGGSQTWPQLLAQRINTEQGTRLRAGQRSANGDIQPVPGQNTVFAAQNSGIQRVELEVKEPVPPATMQLSGPASDQQLDAQGNLDLSFSAAVTGRLVVTATVYDAQNNAKGSVSATLNNATQTLTVPVRQASAGAHTLVVVGRPDTGSVIQQSVALQLRAAGTAQYDFVYPNQQSQYRAGTRVLQPKNGRIYECRPFPNSGWCPLWSAGNNAYEPGYGWAWMDAWLAR